MYDLPTYRSWFPHIQTGKIWLNHAAVSPVSSRVSHALHSYISSRSVGDIDIYPGILKTVDHTKRNLAALIHTTPDRIGFTANTSEGLNILANGIDWKPGDRVLLNDMEFPTNVVPFLNLKRLGVEIDFINSRGGELTIGDIESAITPRTRLLSVSFVQFLSGFKADLKTIGALCKGRDIIFCVDSIQGIGAAPLDVQEMKIDFLANGGNKWLMGLMGTGFIYLTQEMQETITQKHAGWTSNRNFFGDFFRYRIDLDETARRYENGTQNYLGIAALEESTSTLLEVGIENIREHLFTITDPLFTFADEKGFEIVTPRAREKRAGIVTIKHPKAKQIFEELNDNRIIISIREGMLRIAPHFYCSEDDIHVLCSIINMGTE